MVYGSRRAKMLVGVVGTRDDLRDCSVLEERRELRSRHVIAACTTERSLHRLWHRSGLPIQFSTEGRPAAGSGDTNNTCTILLRATSNTGQLSRHGYPRSKLWCSTLCSTPKFSRVYTTHVFHLGLSPMKLAGWRDPRNQPVI